MTFDWTFTDNAPEPAAIVFSIEPDPSMPGETMQDEQICICPLYGDHRHLCQDLAMFVRDALNAYILTSAGQDAWGKLRFDE